MTLLIGVGSALFFEFPWNWIFPILWISYLICLKKRLTILLLPAMMAYCFVRYGNMPKLNETVQEVEGVFSITSLQSYRSPFQKGMAYKGTLFLPEATLPCSIYLQGPAVYKADRNYVVYGKLCERGLFDYTLKPIQWIPIEGSWSLAQWRFSIKERYRSFLEKQFDPNLVDFLIALTTGDLDNRLLRYEFEQIGLQHVLGISGFHFVILIGLLSFVLSFFLCRETRLCILLIAVNAFVIFAGFSPAVQRCWMTAVVYLLAKRFYRSVKGPNLLGFALGCEVVANPLIATNVGFQLTFASCFGIFFLYPLIDQLLCAVFPKRNAVEAAALSFLSKHISIFSNFLRKSMSLTIAVNLVILPILLVQFHFFSPLSFLYNLFFPFCVDASLFIFFIGLVLHLFSAPIAILFFSFSGWLFSKFLNLASYPPIALDYPVFCSIIPPWIIPFWIGSLFFLSVRWQKLASLRNGFDE